MCDRIDKLCNNWDVLISEACSDTLMILQEKNEEYAAAIQQQIATIEALRKLTDEAQLSEPQRVAMEEYLDVLVYGIGTQELRACYLAGAGDGLRLAHQLGLLKI